MYRVNRGVARLAAQRIPCVCTLPHVGSFPLVRFPRHSPDSKPLPKHLAPRLDLLLLIMPHLNRPLPTALFSSNSRADRKLPKHLPLSIPILSHPNPIHSPKHNHRPPSAPNPNNLTNPDLHNPHNPPPPILHPNLAPLDRCPQPGQLRAQQCREGCLVCGGDGDCGGGRGGGGVDVDEAGVGGEAEEVEG